jgi:hypothetical protein
MGKRLSALVGVVVLVAGGLVASPVLTTAAQAATFSVTLSFATMDNPATNQPYCGVQCPIGEAQPVPSGAPFVAAVGVLPEVCAPLLSCPVPTGRMEFQEQTANSSCVPTAPPFQGQSVLLDTSGFAYSPVMTLPDGFYNLFYQYGGDSNYNGASLNTCFFVGSGTPTPPPFSFESAFQANTGNLYVNGDLGSANLQLGMARGTSPAITTLGTSIGGLTGYEVAFQANTGDLWNVGANNIGDTHLGMMAGTSPSIVDIGNGGFQVAFQANTGDLWIVGSNNIGDTHVGMMAGTSPSIVVVGPDVAPPGGGYEVAVQGNNGDLWIGTGGYGGPLNFGDTHLGMMAGTSPSVAYNGLGGVEEVFQANTGDLWIVGTNGVGDRHLGMMAGTSPSVAVFPNGSYEVAFQANTGDLWTVGANNIGDTHLGMMAETSPNIVGVGDPNVSGSYEVAFQANTGDMWTVGANNLGDTGLGMMAGTSPCLTSSFGSSCAPGGPTPVPPPPPPTVTAASPAGGPSTGGLPVAITGTNFTGVTSVTFGGVPATSFIVLGPTKILAVSPPGSGTVDLVVTNGGGPSPTTPADRFTYLSPLIVTLGYGFTNQLVGSVPAPSGASLNQLTATVSWGDGSITTAALSNDPSSQSGLLVSGSHIYWTPGIVHYTITLTDQETAISQHFVGEEIVLSTYTAMGDSYSSGEGADWTADGPQNAGCSASVYRVSAFDPAHFASNTDFIGGSNYNYEDQVCLEGVSAAGDGSNVCHRSTSAYPQILAQQLGIPGLRLDFVACSGDTSYDAISGHSDTNFQKQSSQLYGLGPTTSLVTLSFAGDDLGFAGIVQSCVTPIAAADNDCIGHDTSALHSSGYETTGTYPCPPSTPCDFYPTLNKVNTDPHDGQPTGMLDSASSSLLPPPGLSPSTLPSLTSSMASLDQNVLPVHDRLVFLLRSIATLAPAARIVVIGYPRWFPNPATSSSDEHFDPLEQGWINDRINLVDNVIHDAADESGVAQYVDVSGALGTHTLNNDTGPISFDASGNPMCSGDVSWLNGIDLVAAELQNRKVEEMHPNACGQMSFADDILSQANLYPGTSYSPYPSESTPFTLAPGASVSIPFTVLTGQRFTTITAHFATGQLAATLTDPRGKHYVMCPSSTNPCVPGFGAPASGSDRSVFETFTLGAKNPSTPGTWLLNLTNDTDKGLAPSNPAYDSGSMVGEVDVFTPSYLPTLGPAGVVAVVDSSFVNQARCTATFQALVNPQPASEIASFSWYDDHGNPQPATTTKISGDTMQMSAGTLLTPPLFDFLLKTQMKNGSVRWTPVTNQTVC